MQIEYFKIECIQFYFKVFNLDLLYLCTSLLSSIILQISYFYLHRQNKLQFLYNFLFYWA